MPTTKFDGRFSDPAAGATPWEDAAQVLERAELYWLTTVRADGRPHVTPLVGVFHDGAVHFCTGLDEQKARNLEHNRQLAVTTGNNAWAEGLDVVVEGTATRIDDDAALQPLARRRRGPRRWAVQYRPAARGSSRSATGRCHRGRRASRPCSGANTSNGRSRSPRRPAPLEQTSYRFTR